MSHAEFKEFVFLGNPFNAKISAVIIAFCIRFNAVRLRREHCNQHKIVYMFTGVGRGWYTYIWLIRFKNVFSRLQDIALVV